MQIDNLPFGTTDWASLEKTEYSGETGKAYWQTKHFVAAAQRRQTLAAVISEKSERTSAVLGIDTPASTESGTAAKAIERGAAQPWVARLANKFANRFEKKALAWIYN